MGTDDWLNIPVTLMIRSGFPFLGIGGVIGVQERCTIILPTHARGNQCLFAFA